MKKTMKKQELATLFTGIDAVLALNEKFKAQFQYALIKNKNRLLDEIKVIEETSKGIVEDYNKERIEICIEMSVKDESGKPVVKGNEYDFGENLVAFGAKIAELKEKHKEALEENEKFLESDTEIELHLVKLSEVPDLSGTLIQGIFNIIEE